MQCPLFIFLSNTLGLNQMKFLIQIKLFVSTWSTVFCIQSSIIMIFLWKNWLILMALQVKPYVKSHIVS